jgi:nucleotidyltransferase substrate binding protein (TIGR01987 family)
MKKSEIYLSVKKLENAVTSLKEAASIAQTDLEKDGTIQRFEFTVELLWKTLKTILLYNGVECNNPRACIKEAFRNRIIEDDEILLDMLEDRNVSAHIYDEITSVEIFERIKNVYSDILENITKSIQSGIK